jgi:hypothetical protein
VQNRPLRPYLTAWLRRTRKQLATSGRLSETALILSQTEGRTPSEWASDLRDILEGDTIPSLDLVTKIDSILAKPKAQVMHQDYAMLF